MISSPPEIVLCILQSCDTFPELVKLFSVCRYFHSIWLENTTSIIWHMGQSSIPAFDTALMAMRATEIVKEAQKAGKLPPDPFPIAELSGKVRRPSFDEFKKTLDVHHFARCIEHILSLPDDERWFEWNMAGVPEEPLTLRRWRENLHRAIYRVILAGAVLARAYHEPLFLAEQKGYPSFLQEFTAMLQLERAEADSIEWPPLVTDQEARYLRQAPVYDFEAYDKCKPIFWPLIQWLTKETADRILEEGLAPESRKDPKPTRNIEFDSTKEIWFREVLQFLFVHGQLYDYDGKGKFLINDDGIFGFGRLNEDRPPGPLQGDIRTVSVVLFGGFQVEEIIMPASVQDVTGPLRVINPIIRSKAQKDGTAIIDINWASSASVDIPLLLEALYWTSGQPNHLDGWPAPHPPLQLFNIMLRDCFNLRFAKRAFELYYAAPFNEFIRERSIFYAPGDGCSTWERLFDDAFPPPIQSYSPIN